MNPNHLFEDFVPISESRALITTGRSLQTLDWIEEVDYHVDASGLVRLDPGPSSILATGAYLRLGHKKDGRLVFSDSKGGVFAATEQGTYSVRSNTAHQPWWHTDGKIYYTDHWPYTEIHVATPFKLGESQGTPGERFVGPFVEYVQLGNPKWSDDGVMFFEARTNPHPAHPERWEVWRREPNGNLHKVCPGANPCPFGKYLFWGEWNGRAFTYHRAELVA